MGLKDLFKILVIILGIPCYLLSWSYINIFFILKCHIFYIENPAPNPIISGIPDKEMES